ncbi:MAG: hypothetical protein WCE79_19585 [Xanthobacteraceae bacterium]
MMKATTPRISAAAAIGPNVLRVTWKNGHADQIDLSEWIDTGSAILAPLRDPSVFGGPHVADYGASVVWGDDDDLRIDALHLERIAGRSRKSA